MAGPSSSLPRSAGSGAAVLAAVLLGGVLGTGLRLAIDLALLHDDTAFPLGTLLINVVGSFALGLLVTTLWDRSPLWLKAGLGAGVVGSFTTFSAVMVSLVAQASHGLWLLAAGYLVLSLVLGLGAALLGLRLGTRRAGTGPAAIDWVDE